MNLILMMVMEAQNVSLNRESPVELSDETTESVVVYNDKSVKVEIQMIQREIEDLKRQNEDLKAKKEWKEEEENNKSFWERLFFLVSVLKKEAPMLLEW